MPAIAALTSSIPLTPTHADELRCPKCDQPLRRLTAGLGSFLLTCPNRARVVGRLDRSSLESREHCGQKIHVLSVEGIAYVLPLSNAQFEKYQKAYPGAASLYAELGIIPTRPGSEFVPCYPCLQCSNPTRLYDLRNGYCRECKP